ncbi:hypothetical protein A8938_3386 [Algoriphagus zhangzhouensis]|uniref:Uncharacterized protein n=1 Tax=Algoriphagus zhangzhouensis TaxID=1073327 RepID=A0A1M7ZHI1_9BACT|nr:hypothetical protein A8938_3386 [Algoriphagus zhangzhouensis]SHO64333.1 hypothetical protein SAMN04488108_3381 [Algoriphagus zhangzhouensis]
MESNLDQNNCFYFFLVRMIEFSERNLYFKKYPSLSNQYSFEQIFLYKMFNDVKMDR